MEVPQASVVHNHEYKILQNFDSTSPLIASSYRSPPQLRRATQNYMPAMPFAPRREKILPDISVDVDASGTEVEDEGLWFLPSPKIATSANTNKALPSIKVENTLSVEEMSRLHELWNGAGLSARAHRRRGGRNPTPRRIPAPISIPEPGIIPLIPTFANTPMTSTTPPTTGTRRRWGFLSARPLSETQKAEKKVPNALETLRTMAQDRLKKKLRYAKSAPNLGDQAAQPEKGVAPQSAVPIPTEAAPEGINASSPRTRSSPGELATPRTVVQPEDMDENAIYFIIDPNWRASRGSVQFQGITPIPNSSASLGRPDSPLLHRHDSLDQLSSAIQEAIKSSTTMEFPDLEVHSSDKVLQLIDELHAYLEL